MKAIWGVAALALLTGVSGVSVAAEGSGLGSVAVGYEDNVVLAPDQVASDSESGDNFFEVLGVGLVPLTGGDTADLSLKGSAYVLDYWDLDEFDLATLRAGPELSVDGGAWRWRLEASLARVYLDREAFEQLATVETGLRWYLAEAVSWAVEYERDWVTAYRPYRYLDGTEDQVQVSGRYDLVGWRLQGGYELALNDREGLRENGDFASYSPTRHTLFAELGIAPGQWRLDLTGEVRFSRYQDPHRQGGETKTRKDVRYRGSVRIARNLGGGWSVFGEANRTVNDSNLEQAPFTDYDYRTTYYLVGGDYLF